MASNDARPRILVISDGDSDSFNWMSDGWYQLHQRGTASAEALMSRAHAAIREGKDVADTVRRLEEAGFEVVRVAPMGFHGDFKD